MARSSNTPAPSPGLTQQMGPPAAARSGRSWAMSGGLPTAPMMVWASICFALTMKSRSPVVFADGLYLFFTVNSFPTVMVIDRVGKIAYRSNGFEPDTFELNLAVAVRRALAPQGASSPAGNLAP